MAADGSAVRRLFCAYPKIFMLAQSDKANYYSDGFSHGGLAGCF
jgi:hypothetical protein